MSLPQEIIDSAKRSFLSAIPENILEALLSGGILVDLKAGTRSEPTETIKIALVLSGLYRMQYEEESGKSVTVRFIGPDEFMGIPAMVGGQVQLITEALTDGKLWVISMEPFRKIVKESQHLSWLVAEEVGRRLYSSLTDQIYHQCRNVKDRLLYQLREIASKLKAGPDGQILVPLKQQDLADGIGTSREVVARALKELKEEGLLETSREQILLIHLERWKISETAIRS